jgi:hypothetical protein
MIMARKTESYIPATDAAFLAWVKNFYTVCDEMTTAWGLPAARITALGVMKTNFETVYDKCKSDQKTKADTQDKNDRKAALETECRAIAQEFLMHSSKITNTDRVRLGLHVPDTTRTPVGVPAHAPLFVLERTKVACRFLLRIMDSETGKEAVPYGYNGAVVFYGVFDEPPSGPEKLPKSVLASTCIFPLNDFKPEEEGRRAYIALQWENEHGQRGPWSDMQSMIVP